MLCGTNLSENSTLVEINPGVSAWLGAKADTPKGAFYWLSDHYPVDQDLFQDGEPGDIDSTAPAVIIKTRDRVGLDDISIEPKLHPFCRICPGNEYVYDVCLKIVDNI